MFEVWSEPIAPALMAAGILCAILPWANRENPWIRASLVMLSLAMTWNYLVWRVAALPQFGSVDWVCGVAFLSIELLTPIGGTITWLLLTRTSSRSAAVGGKLPCRIQRAPV